MWNDYFIAQYGEVPEQMNDEDDERIDEEEQGERFRAFYETWWMPDFAFISADFVLFFVLIHLCVCVFLFLLSHNLVQETDSCGQ